MAAQTDAEVFEAHRDLMFAVAYRMLGTIADAEDAVQDAWLRWSAEPRSDVGSSRAYLCKIIANTALNRLRSARARREAYIGPWLPEPLLTAAGPDVEERAELAESVSVAMLVVLESLTPDERAVFVLREVFGFSHAEIGSTLGRSPASVRQIAHRAREHVHARRRRFAPVDPAQNARITEEFMAAAASGDVQTVMSMLAPDVVWTADSGGKASAARRPVVGAEKVARAVVGLVSRGIQLPDVRVETVICNAAPAVLLYQGDHLEGVFTVEIADGKITNFYAMRNPDKLVALATARTISRS